MITQFSATRTFYARIKVKKHFKYHHVAIKLERRFGDYERNVRRKIKQDLRKSNPVRDDVSMGRSSGEKCFFLFFFFNKSWETLFSFQKKNRLPF